MKNILDLRFILILFLCICMFFLYREIEFLNKKTNSIEKKITQLFDFKPEHYKIIEDDELVENAENTQYINYIHDINKIDNNLDLVNDIDNDIEINIDELNLVNNEMEDNIEELNLVNNEMEDSTEDLNLVNGGIKDSAEELNLVNDGIEENIEELNLVNGGVECNIDEINSLSNNDSKNNSNIEYNKNTAIKFNGIEDSNILENSDNETIEEFSNECSEDINIYSNDNDDEDHSSVLESYLEKSALTVDDLLKNKLIELQNMATDYDISLVNNLGKRKTKLLLAKDIILKKNI